MSNIKKFVPCIYLYNNMAIKGFDDTTVLKDDPVELARKFEYFGADEIIVFDLSNNDEEHEAALDTIRLICDRLTIPVIGAGNVKRLEDIKKLLYAGCTHAVLNYSKADNIAITEEASKRFGKNKLYASVDNLVQIYDNSNLLESYVDSLIFIRATSLRDALSETEMKVYGVLPEIALDKLLSLCEATNLIGICGDIVSDNFESIQRLKDLLGEKDIVTYGGECRCKWSELKLNSDGLIPAVVQDYLTDEVLMVAYMNEEAYNKTFDSGLMTYYSRSRQSLWVKGETSGHIQHLYSCYVDCDKDTLLFKVQQEGAACHTGNRSCFYTPVLEKEVKAKDNPLTVFENVMDIILDRKVNPKEGSYTNYLFDKGIDKILKKLGEEATEIVIAAKNPNTNETKYEIADFLYHCMVLMAELGISWEEITEELAKR